MLSLTTIANELSDSESLTESCQTPPSLAISEHSSVRGTPQAIRDWLMSSQAASPANHLVMQENDSEPTTQEICGRQPLTASASYDPDTHSWKTYQGWLLADISAPSFQTFTKAGTTADGEFYPLPKWEHRIREIAYGLEPNNETFFHTPNTTGMDGGSNSRKALRKRLEKIPTPTASDWKGGAASGRDSELKHYLLRRCGKGYPNPNFLEWLMGWPTGWSALKPLETDRFQQWQQQHGSY